MTGTVGRPFQETAARGTRSTRKASVIPAANGMRPRARCEDFDSEAVVLQGPAEPEALVGLGEAVPPQRPDPGAPKRSDEPPQVNMGWKRGLEDRDGWFRGREGTRTQNPEGAPRDAIAEVRSLDQFVLGEAMQRAGQLFRMDAEPPPQSLERDLGGRVLGEELEDLAVMIPQVVERCPRGWVHGGRHHARPAQGGGSP